MAQSDFSEIKGLLDSAHQVALLLPKDPKFDVVAAALALKLSLDQSGRSAVVVSPDPVTVEYHRLVGADAVVHAFGGRNLVITFPGQTEIVDKVSYNVENNILQLVITPKPNTPGLDYQKLKFVSGGAQADLLILMGVGDLSELGQIYLDSKDLLTSTKRYSFTEEPYSQTTARMISSLSLPISADSASNLFFGLQKATDNFQKTSVTADTFEAAAFLMRAGATFHSPALSSDFPTGSIPVSPAIADQPIPTVPEPDWYEPKIYKGTTVS